MTTGKSRLSLNDGLEALKLNEKPELGLITMSVYQAQTTDRFESNELEEVLDGMLLEPGVSKAPINFKRTNTVNDGVPRYRIENFLSPANESILIELSTSDASGMEDLYLPHDDIETIFCHQSDSSRFDAFVKSIMAAQIEAAELAPSHPVKQETKDAQEFKQFLAYLEKKVKNKLTMKAILTKIASVDNPLTGKRTSEDIKQLLLKSKANKSRISEQEDKTFRAMARIVGEGPKDFEMDVIWFNLGIELIRNPKDPKQTLIQ